LHRLHLSVSLEAMFSSPDSLSFPKAGRHSSHQDLCIVAIPAAAIQAIEPKVRPTLDHCKHNQFSFPASLGKGEAVRYIHIHVRSTVSCTGRKMSITMSEYALHRRQHPS